MSKIQLSWNDRFALIDTYNPTDEVICAAFGLTANELKTARALRKAGTFQANKRLDVASYSNVFDNVKVTVAQAPSMPMRQQAIEANPGTATTHTRPETASKRVVVKVPQKRGRKGNKIQTALLAVPTTPMLVETFSSEHGISVAVLRQSKRFIDQMSTEDQAKVGKIVVKQDKNTKQLMIWRE